MKLGSSRCKHESRADALRAKAAEPQEKTVVHFGLVFRRKTGSNPKSQEQSESVLEKSWSRWEKENLVKFFVP